MTKRVLKQKIPLRRILPCTGRSEILSSSRQNFRLQDFEFWDFCFPQTQLSLGLDLRTFPVFSGDKIWPGFYRQMDLCRISDGCDFLESAVSLTDFFQGFLTFSQISWIFRIFSDTSRALPFFFPGPEISRPRNRLPTDFLVFFAKICGFK